MASVSIVVPVYNAAKTLETTLASISAQTWPDWESILIDDGSTDPSSSIIAAHVKSDPRFKSIRQDNAGAGAARNAGLAAAVGNWVLFLDSDDRLAPEHLERMLAAADRNPTIDVLHCGWRRVVNGQPWWTSHPAVLLDDPFAVTVRYCPFAIHSALVQRSALSRVGGFDRTLRVAEDWDLWQGLARSGATFAPVDEVWADVYVQAGSLSSNTARHLSDGLEVIRRGHAPDPRGRIAKPAYELGAPISELSAAVWNFSLWMAGAAIGRGEDAVAMLRSIEEPVVLTLDPAVLAELLEDGVVVGAMPQGQPWPDLWPKVEGGIAALLHFLDERSTISLFDRRLSRALEDRVARQVPPDRSATVGGLHLQPIDATRPIGDVVIDGMERLRASIWFGKEELGQFEEITFGGISGERIARRLETFSGNRRLLELRLPALVRDPAFWKQVRDHTAEAHYRALLRETLAAHLKGEQFGRVAAELAANSSIRPRLSLPETAGPAVMADEERFAAIIAEEQELQTVEPLSCPAELVKWVNPDYTQPAYWEKVFETKDPWDYTNSYEATKYGQTLGLIRGLKAQFAIEIACAEGEFTQALAAHVGHLLATDISVSAIRRTAERCAGIGNVLVEQFDLLRAETPSQYDLVVCSEVLYYVADRATLAAFAAKLCRHLHDGGSIVMAHANLLVDEPEATGFGWPHAFGAKGIGDVFAEQEGLDLADEIWTPLYRIQRFVKSKASETKRVVADIPFDVPERVLSQVRWRGGHDPEPSGVWHDFPILMYHRIAEEGPSALSRWRLNQATFEAQLRLLREHGWRGITLDRLKRAILEHVPLPPRCLMLTFDDAYQDFAAAALPLLHRYGFPATVFAPVAQIGATADWDRTHGEPAPILGWDALRNLEQQDVIIGAHGYEHLPLSLLAPEDLVRQLARSRFALASGLGHDVTAMAYPFGDMDPAIRNVAEACGFKIAMTCVDGFTTAASDPLALPRIEVRGDMDLGEFARRLGQN